MMVYKFVRKAAFNVASVFVSMVLASTASAEAFFNLDTKLKYDNNLTNAQRTSDIVGDALVVANINGGYYFQFSDSNSLQLQADLGAEAYNTYHGLNNVSLGGSAFLKHKWDLGLYAPWTGVSVSATRLDYNENVRDGWQYQAQLSAGKRVTEHLDLWVDFELQKHTADKDTEVDPGVSGAAFDTLNKILKLDAVYTFDDRTLLMLGYQVRRGDVVSTTIEESPDGTWDGIVRAVALDPMFGPHAEAYRILGTTHIFGMRISSALSTNSVLAFEYQRYITHGAGNINYYKSMPALIFSYGF
jgi:hypothetical protein